MGKIRKIEMSVGEYPEASIRLTPIWLPKFLIVRCISPLEIPRKLSDPTVKSIREKKVVPLDWDLDTVEITKTSKFISTQMRFVESTRWGDTPLFAEYRRELEKGNLVRGHDDLELLEEFYENRYSRIFHEMSRSGFSLRQLLTLPVAELPWTVRNKKGSHLFGDQGNHRLAIARILGLRSFPVVLRGASRQQPRKRRSP